VGIGGGILLASLASGAGVLALGVSGFPSCAGTSGRGSWVASEREVVAFSAHL
jgi:hypothetical protein